MQRNQLIGFGMLGALGLAVLGGLIESTNDGLAQVLYTVGGLGMFVFGIWAAVWLLTKKS